jgi:biopolymer transport protein TolR
MAMGPILGPGRRGRRSPMAEINVTPMVDVMLVLLIIFMVTAPLLAAGVQVDLPDSKAAALEQDRAPVAITLDASGAIFVDQAPVAEADLAARLAQLAASSRERGGPRIFLRADRGLDYGRVMRVMGEINRAGLRRIAMVGSPPNAAAAPADAVPAEAAPEEAAQ